MKSFRVYVAPGRVLSGAGWWATGSAIAGMIAAISFPDLWEPLIFSKNPTAATGLIVGIGLVAFGIVGGGLKLAGLSLSKDDSPSP